MASLRNLAVGILRAHGHHNIAAALRYHARDATRLLPCSASPAHEPDNPAPCRDPARKSPHLPPDLDVARQRMSSTSTAAAPWCSRWESAEVSGPHGELSAGRTAHSGEEIHAGRTGELDSTRSWRRWSRRAAPSTPHAPPAAAPIPGLTSGPQKGCRKRGRWRRRGPDAASRRHRPDRALSRRLPKSLDGGCR
jgi:hypothetical protein